MIEARKLVRDAWRIVNAGFFCITLSFYYKPDDDNPVFEETLRKLTVQGMLFLCLYTLSALMDPYIEAMAKVTSFLQHLSHPVAVLITIQAWVFRLSVDNDGLWTFKNNFFHTFNALSCILSLVILNQKWDIKKLVIPLTYGFLYGSSEALAQYLSDKAVYPELVDFEKSMWITLIIYMTSLVNITWIFFAFYHASKHINCCWAKFEDD